MTTDDLNPYLGGRCHVLIRCRPCRGSHVLVGRLERGRHLGDVTVEGQTYSLEDVEQVWRPAEPPRRRPTFSLLIALVRSLQRRLARGSDVLRGPAL